MTLGLLLFGLVIGLFSILLFTSFSTYNFINFSSGYLENEARFITNGDNQYFEQMLGKVVDAKKFIVFRKTDISFNLNHINNIELISFNSSENTWYNFYLDDKSRLHKNKIQSTEAISVEKPDLNKKITILSKNFFKSNGDITFLINVSNQSDSIKYYIKISAVSRGLLNIFISYLGYFACLGLVILLLSFFLGLRYSKRFAVPIKKLSMEAQKIKKGDYSLTFKVNSNDEIGELCSSLNQMTAKFTDNIRVIQKRISTMETMNQIDKAVLSSISRTDLLERVVGFVSNLYSDSSIAIAVRNNNNDSFEILAIFNKEKEEFHKRYVVNDNKFTDIELLSFQRLYQTSNIDVISNLIEKMDAEYRNIFNVLLNIPLFISDKYIGSLLISRKELNTFLKEDIDIISMLADQISVTLQSIKSFEEKESLLLELMTALTRAIDAKSRWTAGHSERVAFYCSGIAQEFNFNEHESKMLRIAAILHDIGKIAVPELILDKPEILLPDEYDIIKQHPAHGAKIIGDIKSYNLILPSILYHHEHWDGSGYPEGLKDLEIPLFSRIIAVADVYDAITAERPYRSGMSSKNAVVFLRSESGTIFDSEIVEKFIQFLDKLEAQELLALSMVGQNSA